MWLGLVPTHVEKVHTQAHNFAKLRTYACAKRRDVVATAGNLR